MGLGMLLGSIMTSIWQLYVFYGILVGVGMGMGASLWATISRWFKARRGLALGLMGAGAGVGNLIVPPLAGYFIRSFGISSAYLIIGAISLMLISLSALVLRKEPGALGLRPYGVGVKPETEPQGLSRRKPQEAGGEWGASQALRSGSFWVLSTVSFFFGVGLFIVMTNIVAHATDLGVSEAIAPYLLSIIGGSGVIGTIVMGIASERVGTRWALALCLDILGLALFWLTGVSSFALFCIIAAIFGFGWGGAMPQLPGITAEFFGLKSLGVILGFGMLVSILGGAVGSEVGNLIYDFTQPHSYVIAFWLGGGISMAAMVLTLIMRKPRREVLG